MGRRATLKEGWLGEPLCRVEVYLLKGLREDDTVLVDWKCQGKAESSGEYSSKSESGKEIKL